MLQNNLHPISIDGSIYWPADCRKTRRYRFLYCEEDSSATHYFKAESCYDLTLNHSPIIITVNTTVVNIE